MNVSNLFQNRLTGKTVDLLSRALDFGSAKHNVISGNLSNIDTPGYRPKEAVFDENLRQAVEQRAVRLKTTDRKHFSHLSSAPRKGEEPYSVQTSKRKGSKGSALDIDKEMAAMVQNNLFYQTSAQLLSKKFESLKLAIQGGR
jgi:flagellar basal-body rod protein FlgB